MSTGLSSVTAGTSSSSSLGVEGSPTFPKWLLPRHYPGLKLKTGNEKGSHLAVRLKAPPGFLQAASLLRRRRLGSRGLQPRFRPSPHLAPSATEAVIPWGPKESADAGERDVRAQEGESGNGSEAGQGVSARGFAGSLGPGHQRASPARPHVAGSRAWAGKSRASRSSERGLARATQSPAAPPA